MTSVSGQKDAGPLGAKRRWFQGDGWLSRRIRIALTAMTLVALGAFVAGNLSILEGRAILVGAYLLTAGVGGLVALVLFVVLSGYRAGQFAR